MARASRLVKPERQELIRLEVLRREQLSPHWMRVTLGRGDVAAFHPMGFDQWFRLFLPVGGESGLARIPEKANTILGYLAYLHIPEGQRPVLRNYTVRQWRPAPAVAGGVPGSVRAGSSAAESSPVVATQPGQSSAEIDVDFVLHGDGPAAQWARTCEPGESVVILDEGIAFNPERGVENVLLAADETGLPAVAGVCASLPEGARGTAYVELPDAADVQDFPMPPGVRVVWLPRTAGQRPGSLALQALRDHEIEDVASIHAYLVGEQSLPTQGRRLLVTERGVAKDAVSFCGYWRLARERG